MANKEFLLNNNLKVTVYKRRSCKSIKLVIDSSGSLKVSIPYWLPYKTGLEFVKSKEQWVKKHHKPLQKLESGQPVGKSHHLIFIEDNSKDFPKATVSTNTVIVKYPGFMHISDEAVQDTARKACIRALRKQAEALLPQRVEHLANQHAFSYTSVSIKQLKSRWGSCDQNKNIVLNLFLMQAPWKLIDYVILHELTHTEVLKHGPEFWQAMEKIFPGVKYHKKELRAYSTSINGLAEPTVA